MRALGVLDKIQTSYISPVQYFLNLGSDKVAVNELIGHKLQLKWTGRLFCTVCGKKSNKLFGEGYSTTTFKEAHREQEVYFAMNYTLQLLDNRFNLTALKSSCTCKRIEY